MKNWLCILVVLILLSCSTTKHVPNGKYLLDEVSIKSDTKAVDISTLETFVRQQPNTHIPILGRVGLHIYDMSGDTTKWINRTLQSIGKAPVLYDHKQTAMSAFQMKKELQNEGYINARVDTVLTFRGDKKIAVTYNVYAHEPYRIRNYTNVINDSTVRKILESKASLSHIKSGMLFDQPLLEKERVRMNNYIRNQGCYNFSKEYLYYKADTTLNSHQVDLFLSLHTPKDSMLYKRYRLRNITIRSGFDLVNEDSIESKHPDTTRVDGLNLVRGTNRFLNDDVLVRNNFLKPKAYYSDQMLAQTISSYNRIGAIKQTTVAWNPVDSITRDSVGYLDAQVTLVPANVHWFQTGLDGTNSAGNFGIAPSVAYQHQNLFNSATLFTLKLKGAYEFISGGKSSSFMNKSYFEYGVESSLKFPQFLFPFLSNKLNQLPTASTAISMSLTNQHRPEYTRQFFNTTLGYRWTSQKGSLTHYLNLLDVNYVRMPWTSASFDSTYLSDPMMRTTYSNELIAGTNYTITYANTHGNDTKVKKNLITIRAGIDESGLLPRLFTSLGKTTLNEDGQREILGIAYSEYIKGDVSFAHTYKFDRKNSIAYHVAVGVANPFGNSDVLPFEKRYFSGGANSVRGWSTRTLGPGSFKPANGSDFVNQVGDIQLDLSLEFRKKISKYFELAAFFDGGNIWTIRDYESQPGGLFRISSFYKEIALAYGTGIRFDLGFLLLRLDFGMKAYDPSRDLNDRWVVFRPQFNRDFAWHFAIGYPF